MLNLSLYDESARIIDLCQARHWLIATAESCTGGMIAASLTAVPGSSAVVDRGFVTYSNAAKAETLGVPPDLIAQHGAVSAPVAEAMARGALVKSAAQVSLACTGIAGPGGGSADKPVGLVFIGCALADGSCTVERHVFPGDRAAVRRATVLAAFELLHRLS